MITFSTKENKKHEECGGVLQLNVFVLAFRSLPVEGEGEYNSNNSSDSGGS